TDGPHAQPAAVAGIAITPQARRHRHSSGPLGDHALPEPSSFRVNMAGRESTRLSGEGLPRLVGRMGQPRRHSYRIDGLTYELAVYPAAETAASPPAVATHR